MYKILIIKDDLSIAKSIDKYLSNWDYEVKYI